MAVALAGRTALTSLREVPAVASAFPLRRLRLNRNGLGGGRSGRPDLHLDPHLASVRRDRDVSDHDIPVLVELPVQDVSGEVFLVGEEIDAGQTCQRQASEAPLIVIVALHAWSGRSTRCPGCLPSQFGLRPGGPILVTPRLHRSAHLEAASLHAGMIGLTR